MMFCSSTKFYSVAAAGCVATDLLGLSTSSQVHEREVAELKLLSVQLLDIGKRKHSPNAAPSTCHVAPHSD